MTSRDNISTSHLFWISPTNIITFIYGGNDTMAYNYSSFEELLFTAIKNAASAKSVYDIWLELGNTGTPQDFIDSLKGEKGDPGTGSGTGLTNREKYLILSLFEGAAYSNENMQSKYNELKQLWNVEEISVLKFSLNKTSTTIKVNDVETLIPTIEQDNATDKTITWSVNPTGYINIKNGTITGVAVGTCTIKATCGGIDAYCEVTVEEGESVNIYTLPEKTVFVPSEQKVIDTGCKLFESIDTKPQYTILVDFQGADTITASRDTYCLMHCMNEITPWPGITIAMWPNGSLGFNLYKLETTLINSLDNVKQRNTIAIQIKDDQCKLMINSSNGYWKEITGYTSNVSQSLLIGGYQQSDGTKGRFFDGTVYRFEVYRGLLSSDAITNWMSERGE